MTQQSEIDRSFQEFVGHARNGDFGGYMPLEDLVNQPSYNGQTLRNPPRRMYRVETALQEYINKKGWRILIRHPFIKKIIFS
jgi:hypothetical protein